MAAFHWLFTAWPLLRTHSPAPRMPSIGPFLPRYCLASRWYTYLACSKKYAQQMMSIHI